MKRTYQDIGHVLLDLGLDFLDLCSQIKLVSTITKSRKGLQSHRYLLSQLSMWMMV